MSDYRTEIDSLLSQIPNIPNQVQYLHAAEKAVQIADRHQDFGYQLKARQALVKTATYVGFPEKALVAYSYLLAKLDENRDAYREHILPLMTMWHYKWVLGKLPYFPSISREQIATSLEDMERRYEEEGGHRSAVLQYQFDISSKLGEYIRADAALKELDESVSLGFSMLDDCNACFRSMRVQHYIRQDLFDKAIEESSPILTGAESCDEIPDIFYHKLIVPYLMTGQKEEALKLLKKSKLEHLPKRLSMNADGVILLTANKQLTRALELVEHNWVFAHASREQRTPFDFYLAARYLFRVLAKDDQKEIQLRLQDNLPFYRAEGKYAIHDLLEVLNGRITEIQKAFDQRNGTDVYASKEAQIDRLQDKYA